MVKATINDRTTVYVSPIYQIANPNTTGQKVTKFYAGGAMRVGAAVYYTLSDHIGSTSITLSNTGTKIAEMRYKAWGEVRYDDGTLQTDRTYTGQRSYTDDFGLMFYNARWYDSSIGRFAQADNINIKVGDVQSLDRFAYVLNNPVNKNDPSGHYTPPCDWCNKFWFSYDDSLGGAILGAAANLVCAFGVCQNHSMGMSGGSVYAPKSLEGFLLGAAAIGSIVTAPIAELSAGEGAIQSDVSTVDAQLNNFAKNPLLYPEGYCAQCAGDAMIEFPEANLQLRGLANPSGKAIQLPTGWKDLGLRAPGEGEKYHILIENQTTGIITQNTGGTGMTFQQYVELLKTANPNLQATVPFYNVDHLRTYIYRNIINISK